MSESKPYKTICHGHTFFCDSCENALKELGVIEFETKSIN